MLELLEMAAEKPADALEALKKFRPTHRCFDDALEFMSELVSADRNLAKGRELLLAHGICTMSDGRRYAHAWVEFRGDCYNGVLGPNGRHYLQFTRSFFYRAFRVVETEHYTVFAAWEANKKSGHFGPWTEKLRALVNARGTLRKEGA